MIARSLNLMSFVRVFYARTILLVFSIFACISLQAVEPNIDTPGLSFENKFSNWKIYKGSYYGDRTTNETVYQWEEADYVKDGPDNRGANRFAIVDKHTDDEVIACSNFKKVPADLPQVARLGKPTTVEGQGTSKAAAERMVYTFVVTENTTLLNYRYACVLKDPDNSSNPHNRQQRPSFIINITATDPSTKLSTTLPCGTFEAIANSSSSDLQRNPVCQSSSAYSKTGNETQYYYKDWTSASVDLRDYVGQTITIEVINRDCLTRDFPYNSGSHDSYGYFWAETRKLELISKNCGEDNPTITAPEGFDVYEWKRSDGNTIDVDVNNPRVVTIPRNSLYSGVTYSCTMSNPSSDCSSYTLTTDLSPVSVMPAFEAKVKCGGDVDFINKSNCEGDSIVSYTWDFGDGGRNFSKEDTVKHVYYSDGNSYSARLYAISSLGCIDSFKSDVAVPLVPELIISGNTNVCEGTPIRLTANGASDQFDYVWQDGSLGSIYATIADSTRMVSVTVTDRYQCQYTASKNLIVRQKPHIFIESLPTVCMGDSLVMVAYNAVDYSWNTGNVGDSLLVRPQNSTTYVVIGSGANGCLDTAYHTVTVNPLPTISIDGPTELCVGESGTLTANGGALYQWDDLFTGGTRIVTPVKAERVKYTVRGTDANGCSNTASWTVSGKASPVLEYSGVDSVCSGHLARVSVIGAERYKWFDGSQTNTYSKVMKVDTVWKVEGTTNGCTSVLEIPITIKPSPFVMIGGNTSVCKGDTLTLWGRGAASYVWATGHTTDTIKTVPVDENDSQYQVVGVGENGCSSVATLEITIIPKPKISISGDESVCKNSYAKLKASGECVAYTWSNAMQGESISALIDKQTTFTVTGVDANSCSNTAMFIVSPVLPPDVDFLGDTVVCSGNIVTLGGKGAAEYVWQDSITGSNYAFIAQENTYVKLKGITNNCAAERLIYITVKPKPNILIMGDDLVCPGQDFQITAQGVTKFSWNTGDTTASISYAPQIATTYYLTGWDDYGCVNTAEYRVNVRPLPPIQIQLLSYRGCPETKDTAIVLAKGGVFYEWTCEPNYNGLQNNKNSERVVVLVDDTTTIHLLGRDENGCSNETKLVLAPLSHPTVSFEIQPKWIEQSNPTVSMKGVSPAAATWYWTPGDGTEDKEGRLFHYRYNVDDLSDSVEVTVRAVDSVGCQYTGSEFLYVWKDFWAPTGFTPNRDEKNETFHFFGGEYITDFHFYIFNRQGDIVFDGDSFDAEWDGTFNGKECPWGVYGWVANYNSNVKGTNFSGERKGFVTIVR